MDKAEADVLDRATHTIVQQVESLKEMVNAFSDYARAPKLEVQTLLLHDLLREVLDLYKSNEQIINIQLTQPEPLIEADAGRLRQLMHNLIKNALESVSDVKNAQLLIETRWQMEAGERYVEICVEDNGGGFSQEALEHIFEPYVTTKARGTGLGLAIVKKIVEEHNGQIQACNTSENHARIEIRFTAAVNPVRKQFRFQDIDSGSSA
jgi:nitrogen fixation/metabolism regulation signal transduction histidine kinase